VMRSIRVMYDETAARHQIRTYSTIAGL